MRVAIVGASGKMGRWCARFLVREGHDVLLVGRDERKLAPLGRRLGAPATARLEDVATADVVLLSVPMGSFEEVVRQLRQHVRPGQVVVEITSVKAAPLAALHRHLKTDRILAVHPMFGPGARGISGQNFVLTPTNPTEAALAKQARDYLEARGGRVSLMTPEEHDEMMAIVLALPHLIALASAETLLGMNRLKTAESVGGSSFELLRMLIESVLSEDPDFYASLQMGLPDSPRAQAALEKRLAEWTARVKAKDSAGFAAAMAALNERWARGHPDFTRAYGDVYRLLEKRTPRRKA